MAHRSPPRKSPISSRSSRAWLANTIIESTFEVRRRFRCAMRVDCDRLDPGAVIRPDPGEWLPRMPKRLDEEELADWRSACGSRSPTDKRAVKQKTPAGEPRF